MATATQSADLPRAQSRRKRRWLGEQERWAIFFLWPAIVGLLVFDLGPILYGVTLSFFKWNLRTPAEFVGVDNYARLFQSPVPFDFVQTIGNTLFFVAAIPIGMSVSLLLAVLVNQKLRGITIFRTLYYLPLVTATAAVSLVWQQIYDPNLGLANYLLDLLGLDPVRWLANPDTIKPALYVMQVWRGAGWGMIIFLAGLQGIPDVYYEASKIDGASGWQRFWRITLPLLSPTIFFVLVLSGISAFQVFDQIFIMARDGGPRDAAATIVLHLYKNAFESGRFGVAAASAMVLFGFIIVLTIIQFYFQKRWVNYDL